MFGRLFKSACSQAATLLPQVQAQRPITQFICQTSAVTQARRCFCNQREENEMDTSNEHKNEKGSDLNKLNKPEQDMKLQPSLQKFAPVQDEEQIILDIHEEQQQQQQYQRPSPEREKDEPHFLYQKKQRIQLDNPMFNRRGEHGVYDLPELIKLLNLERARDLLALRIPSELHYADQMLICTAASPRHLRAIAEQVRRVHKLKKAPEDPFLPAELEQANDWAAFDLGNLVLHIFLPETRQQYDVETLWAVGPEFDELTQRAPHDPTISLMEKHLRFLQQLQSAQ